MHYTPDGNRALPYNQIIHQLDYEQAAGHWIARHYGIDVVLMFPLAVTSLINSLLFNCPESMAVETLWGSLGLLPIDLNKLTGDN